MSDVPIIKSTDPVILIGSDATGDETTPVNSTDNGALFTNLQDSAGNELLGQKLMAESIPVTLASDQIVTVDFIPDLKNDNRLKVEVLNLGGPIIQVSSDDQSTGYLEAKVIGTTNKIVVSTANPGGDEDLQINIGSDVFDKALNTTDNITEGATKLFFTDERAQDAIGGILTDTASVDFTYNDAGNSISAAVLPAGVNHNALQNYVANQHIDHSTVSINAGTGLSGGGDITASRVISMPNVGTPGTYGSSTQIPVITTDTQGRVSSVVNTTLALTTFSNSSTGTISTSSQTFQASGISIVPNVAGSYIIIAHTEILSATSGISNNSQVAIAKNGVNQSETVQDTYIDASGISLTSFGISANVAMVTLVTANGTTDSFDIYYRRVNGSSVTIGSRRILAIRYA